MTDETCITRLLDEVVLRRLLDRDLPTLFNYPKLKQPIAKSWYVATLYDKVIGAIGYSTAGKNSNINYIYVDTLYRDQGVGRALVYRVCKDLVGVSKSITIHVPLDREYNKLYGFANKLFEQIGLVDDSIIFLRR